MNRQIESTRHDARWVAEVFLPTGKVITITSGWEPSHWESQKVARRRTIREALSRALEVQDSFGVTCSSIGVWKETRRVDQVVEETVTSKFDSEHFLPTVEVST